MAKKTIKDDDIMERREERTRELFESLDTRNAGRLDGIDDLQAGLKRINHPLREARGLLSDVFEKMDRSGSGHITYSDFRQFVSATETQLWDLFQSLDTTAPHGRLAPRDIDKALKSAGISLNPEQASEFFDYIDRDADGFISFDEWRRFLLFVPKFYGVKTLFALYQSSVHDASEGDMLMSSELLDGIGYFVAGGLAGVVSRTATAPFDRLKTYLITESVMPNVKKAAAHSFLTPEWFKNLRFFQAVKTVYADGGLRGFFTGNGLNIIKIMPESAIKFGCFEAFKRAFASGEGTNVEHISPYGNFIAGGCAGAVSQFASYPLDTLRFRVQCEPVTGSKVLFETAKRMWQQNGLKAYYRGLFLGLAGIFPYSAFDLGSFELLKKTYISAKAKRLGCSPSEIELSNMTVLQFGAMSGTIGATIVYPLNSARVRLQAQGSTMHPQTYSGITDVLATILRTEGPRGLYRGLLPNLLKVAPAVSISYLVYLRSKELMNLK